MGFPGKVLAGLEIFVFALFQFGDNDRSEPACDVLINSDGSFLLWKAARSAFVRESREAI